jgi:hypothetical protein
MLCRRKGHDEHTTHESSPERDADATNPAEDIVSSPELDWGTKKPHVNASLNKRRWRTDELQKPLDAARVILQLEYDAEVRMLKLDSSTSRLLLSLSQLCYILCDCRSAGLFSLRWLYSHFCSYPTEFTAVFISVPPNVQGFLALDTSRPAATPVYVNFLSIRDCSSN